MSNYLSCILRPIAGLCLLLLCGPPLPAQDYLTEYVRSELVSEWANYPDKCIKSLKTYGSSALNAPRALEELSSGQADPRTKAYKVAAGRRAADFWQLVATVHEGADVTWSSLRNLVHQQFVCNLQSLADCSDAVRKTGQIAGLAALLEGAADQQDLSKAAVRERYRAAFAEDPPMLFRIVDEMLGPQR